MLFPLLSADLILRSSVPRHILYLDSCQKATGVIILIWDTTCRPWGSFSRFTSTPGMPLTLPPWLFLNQVIGVLISGYLCCRVTDRLVGIKCSICIIGMPGLFIAVPMFVCLCATIHVYRYAYVHVWCWCVSAHTSHMPASFQFYSSLKRAI